jgi:hypothetical protein
MKILVKAPKVKVVMSFDGKNQKIMVSKTLDKRIRM